MNFGNLNRSQPLPSIFNQNQNRGTPSNELKNYSYGPPIVPILNYYPQDNIKRPISRGTYLKNEFNERNELLLEIREQNIKLKYMMNYIKMQQQKEKQEALDVFREMKTDMTRTDEKLKYHSELLEEIRLNLRNLGKTKKFKKQYHWQRTVPAFINLFRFYKYTLELAWNKAAKERMIRIRRLNFDQEMRFFQKWIFGIQNSLIIELQEIKDLKIKVKFETLNYHKNPVIFKKDEIFQYFLKKFFKTLILNATEIKEISLKVQEMLYSYIRDGIYYSKNFLSSFEINRLKFNFFGETLDNTKSSRGMLLALLIVSKVFIHSGILKSDDDDHDVFYPGQINENLSDFLDIFGSLLQFIVRETFRNRPVMMRNRNNLNNYFRNYKIFNPEIEEPITDYITDLNYSDIDEYYNNMIDESFVFSYCSRYSKFVADLQDSIYKWSVLLGNHLRRKYGKKKKIVLRQKEDEDED